MVEQLGTGVHRILKYYGKESFHFTENFTRVVFPSKKKTLGKELGKELGKAFSKNQIAIMELMKNNPKITIAEISKALKISDTAVENNIKKLKEIKIIQRIGGRKEGAWKVKIDERSKF